MAFYGSAGMHPVRSHSRNYSIETFYFTTTSATTVAASLGPCDGAATVPGILTTGHTHASTGVYLFPLREKYRKVIPVGCNMISAVTDSASVTAVVEGGAATNSVTVTTGRSGSVSDSMAGSVCAVTLLLLR